MRKGGKSEEVHFQPFRESEANRLMAYHILERLKAENPLLESVHWVPLRLEPVAGSARGPPREGVRTRLAGLRLELVALSLGGEAVSPQQRREFLVARGQWA